MTVARIALTIVVISIVAGSPSRALAQEATNLVQQICIACHNEFMLQAGLNLARWSWCYSQQ
jgi:hypothetical protein